MPSNASAMMIFIPKKRPHFRVTNPLGRPSGQRTSSSSCSLILIPCTHFSQLASTLVSFPPFLLGDGRNLTVPFTSHFSSRRLLEIIESPIILARHLVLPNCETWVHESYTIALLGEAAHPNLVSRAFQRDEAPDRFSRVAFFFCVPFDLRSSPHFLGRCLSRHKPGCHHISSIRPCGRTAVFQSINRDVYGRFGRPRRAFLPTAVVGPGSFFDGGLPGPATGENPLRCLPRSS